MTTIVHCFMPQMTQTSCYFLLMFFDELRDKITQSLSTVCVSYWILYLSSLNVILIFWTIAKILQIYCWCILIYEGLCVSSSSVIVATNSCASLPWNVLRGQTKTKVMDRQTDRQSVKEGQTGGGTANKWDRKNEYRLWSCVSDDVGTTATSADNYHWGS